MKFLMRVLMGLRLMRRMVMLMRPVFAGVVMLMGLRPRAMRVVMAVFVKMLVSVQVRVLV